MEVYHRHKQKSRSAHAGSWQTGMQQPFKLKDESSILSGPISKRKCVVCKRKKKEQEFAFRYKDRGIRQNTCRKCCRERTNKWYSKNKKRHIANVVKYKKQRYDNARKKIGEYLLSHPCVDCGEADIIVLQFDHVRGKKKYNVGNMAANHSWAEIEKEISKCEVRCANCHQRKTAKSFGWKRKLPS